MVAVGSAEARVKEWEGHSFSWEVRKLSMDSADSCRTMKTCETAQNWTLRNSSGLVLYVYLPKQQKQGEHGCYKGWPVEA